ncbi:hypothetical protein L1887_58324 [Cichorium endivia]|nr:hypothetical protein L1887_58324 [Cichorium endivia]
MHTDLSTFADETWILPVRSSLLSPGQITSRALNMPGLRPFFLVGEDTQSLAWLRQRATELQEIGAAGLAVEVADTGALARIRAAAPSVTILPVNVSKVMAEHAMESKLRPAVELYTVAICIAAAVLCVYSPWAVALSPEIGLVAALAYTLFGLIRLRQAWEVLRYRRNIRRLSRYELTSRQIPVSCKRLFMAAGFAGPACIPSAWSRLRIQRSHIMSTNRPAIAWPVDSNGPLRHATVSAIDIGSCHRLGQCRQSVAPFTTGRRLAIAAWGSSPMRRKSVCHWANGSVHTLVLGTTRVGKTRLAERMYVEAKRAGREKEFYVFHLGWPEISARYNAVGRFGRISEVASRIAGQLSGEGNSAAFREFAWRFVNIIARALIELGRRPDYLQIQRHVVNIDALFIEYAQQFFAKTDPKAWEVIVQLEGKLTEKNIPRHMIGREKRVVAIEQYLAVKRVFDPVMDGLRSAVTAYTQTLSDIEARIGKPRQGRPGGGQFQHPTDAAGARNRNRGTTHPADRVSSTSVPLIEPAHIVSLPKGQMFSFQAGGQLWKVRMPLPKPSNDDAMPKDLQELTQRMRAAYNAQAGQCGAPVVAAQLPTSI